MNSVVQAFVYVAIAGLVLMVVCTMRAVYGLLQRRDQLYSLKYGHFLEQKTRVEATLEKERNDG